jgi:hypothetical protein
VLQEVLTEGYASELSHIRGFASILAGGLPNGQLLQRLVARFIDDRTIERVAEEHRRGRRLIVVTTNLDAQRTVVWNLGAIAASGRSERFDIFREVLVASASIPGIFSPVLVDVEANGRHFNELHVDGGVTRNVLVAPDAVIAQGNFLPSRVSGQIYVIINNKIAPDFDVVKNRPLPIIQRSASTMIKASTNAVLVATYQFAQAHGLNFHFAAIDPAYPTSPTNDFSRDYLLRLFQYGIERARSGNVWQSRILPGISTSKSRSHGTATTEMAPSVTRAAWLRSSLGVASHSLGDVQSGRR